MKLTYAILLLGTTLGSGSAVLAAAPGLSLTPHPILSPAARSDATLTLIDDDEDGEGDGGGWFQSGSGDDNEDDDDDCDDEDDDCAAAGTTGNAAKAGTVAPPQNGLFTNGTAPVVKSN